MKRTVKKEADVLDAFVVDLGGVLRGKKIPAAMAAKVFKAGLNMPRSVFAVDAWGRDVLSAGLVTETGDNDGLCRPVPSTHKPAPWRKDTSQVLLTMPGFFADPRNVLAHVLSLYRKAGLTPVVAAELEFYLIDAARDNMGAPQPPRALRSARHAHILSIAETDAFHDVLSGIRAACRVQGIPADTTISENGPAQFEINLHHVKDALTAADQAVLLKRAVKGAAQNGGLSATFMAKPYADCSGNGLHVHFSILNRAGKNIFSGRAGEKRLRHAVGGLLKTMPDITAILAPNINSYRRFARGSHAPTKMAWGFDNRSCALRVPSSDDRNRRIEYRVAGADANPYLVIAAILAGAFSGLKKNMSAPAPTAGNAYASKAKSLPADIETSLRMFSRSPFVAEYLGADFQRVYAACKRQEADEMRLRVTSAEHDAYLRDA